MTLKPKRLYAGKDIEMITGISTMIESAIEDEAVLSARRPAWQSPFFEHVLAEINSTVKDFFGFDNAKQMRAPTTTVLSIAAVAKRDLAEAKVQIDEDYRNNPGLRDELLRTLGFTAHLKGAQRNDQEALISLLFSYRNNMDEHMRTDLINKGTSPALITALHGYAQLLHDANISQEGQKGRRSTNTDTTVTALNTIYTKVISITNIARKFLKDDQAKADRYSYRRIRAAMNAANTAPKDGPENK